MAIPVCPTDCSSQIPEVVFSECAPETNAGQIYNIYVTNIGQSFADLAQDWTVAADWTGRLDNASTNVDAIRKFHVIGEKPVPEKVEKEISHGRIVSGKKKHTINIEIDETNATNYEMMRTLECGGSFLVWYETSGGLLYGGDDGIVATIQLDEMIPKSEQDLILIMGTVKWTSKFHPERIQNPVA